MTVLHLTGGMRLPDAVEALREIGADPVMRHDRNGEEYWLHRCAHPDHNDNWPSATITAAPDGTLLLNCFSCAPTGPARTRWMAQCLARLEKRIPKEPATGTGRTRGTGTGTGASGVKVAHYDYTDTDGQIAARKVRFEDPDGRKSFLWQRPYGDGWVDGLRGKPLRELPLYGMHTVAGAAVVYVVEGEKDADRLHAGGLAAVSAAGSNPGDIPTDLSTLAGRSIVVIADRDIVGGRLARAWVERIATDLPGTTCLLAQPAVTEPKADVSDHLDAGYTIQQLDFGIRVDDGQSEEEPAEDDLPDTLPSSWLPVDLSAHLDGTYVAEVADLLPRADGQCLLYRGRVSSMYGESESGKTWIALIAAAMALTNGGWVAYIDFESDAATIVGRLRALGVPPATIAARLTYLQPERRPTGADDLDAWDQLLSMELDLVVIDGVTEALVMWGGATKENDDITAWSGAFPRRIAAATGAAVVTIDHVTKSAEGRGRFAIGGQAKLAALDGVGYVVEPEHVLAPGKIGVLHMRVAKDRPGDVRAHSGLWRAADRTQLSAIVTVDASDSDRLVVTVAAPDLRPLDERPPFRPTGLMEKVSRHLESVGDVSMNQLESAISGKGTYVRAACDALEAEGYIRRFPGYRNARMVQLVAEYRESLEEQLARDTPGSA